MFYKSCPKCGKIHPANYKCTKGFSYRVTYKPSKEERKQRSTYAWTKKSIEIRKKANYLCEVCRDEGVYTYSGVEVHHINKLRDRPDLLLDNYNLIALCKRHHEEADDGLINKNYLKELAKKREDI